MASFYLILCVVLAAMERFAFKGVASNLVIYCTEAVKMSNSAAAKTVNAWSGFSFIVPLVVASLAHRYWNRYCTILTSSFLYVVGLLALTSTALVRSRIPTININSSFLFCFLCLTSIGQGGYNPSLQALAAERLGNDEEYKKSLVFQWWYFGACAGSLLGVIIMPCIQEKFGWVLGFAIPAIAMVTSIVLFLVGNRIYTCPQNLGSGTAEDLSENPRSAIDLPEELKVVVKLLPMWTVLLMFAVTLQLPATFFTKQGMEMKRNIGRNFKIPPAALQSAITASTILFLPLYNSVLIPILRKITGREKGITVMQRMGTGMVLSIIAMVIAALVETKRLDLDLHSETVPVSIFWLLPQYILLGISEIFTVVGMQEFFYDEVPVKMKTMGIALWSSVFGVGNFLGILIISGIEIFTGSIGEKSWFSDDMKEARLDKYYWLLAILSSVSLLFYIILCNFFRRRSELIEQ